jgi:hypothetical protein
LQDVHLRHMIKRDFLKRQLEELGRAIAKVIEDAQKLKEEGKVNEGIIKVNEAINDTFHLSVEDIVHIPLTNFIEVLVNEKKLSVTHLNYLGNLLYKATELDEQKNQMTNIKNLHEKILALFDYVNLTEKTFSFERDTKIKAIEGLLKEK